MLLFPAKHQLGKASIPSLSRFMPGCETATVDPCGISRDTLFKSDDAICDRGEKFAIVTDKEDSFMTLFEPLFEPAF